MERKVDKHRAIEVIERLYPVGWTLQQIGDYLGITRERVRQIAKTCGLCVGVPTGSKARAAIRRDSYRAMKDVEEERRLGCTYREKKAIVELCRASGLPDPSRAYSQQHKNAKNRGIEWNLRWKEWWDIWAPYWENRGRHDGELVMCRNGDKGAYEVGNVRIDTMNNNSSEARATSRGTEWVGSCQAKVIDEDVQTV